jgi:hypothetical protein
MQILVKVTNLKYYLSNLFKFLKGNVSQINLTTGGTPYNVTTIVEGKPTQAKFQFSVEDTWSTLFDIENDAISQVN